MTMRDLLSRFFTVRAAGTWHSLNESIVIVFFVNNGINTLVNLHRFFSSLGQVSGFFMGGDMSVREQQEPTDQACAFAFFFAGSSHWTLALILSAQSALPSQLMSNWSTS